MYCSYQNMEGGRKVNFGRWDFLYVLEIGLTLSEPTASTFQLDVAKKVMVPKSKLLLSYFYKQFITPQNMAKRKVHIFPEKL